MEQHSLNWTNEPESLKKRLYMSLYLYISVSLYLCLSVSLYLTFVPLKYWQLDVLGLAGLQTHLIQDVHYLF